MDETSKKTDSSKMGVKVQERKDEDLDPGSGDEYGGKKNFFFLIISTFNYYLFYFILFWLCWVFVSA